MAGLLVKNTQATVLARCCARASTSLHTISAAPLVVERPGSSRAQCYSTEAAGVVSFEEYRKLKKSLKMRSRIAGIPIGLGGVVLSSFINVHLNPGMFEMTPEEVKPILGMDPIMLAAVCGVASGIAGYMVGGAIFTATWKLIAKNQAKELEERDKDFLKRLQRHRFSDVNKYEDDYYGDKVMTLSDYRQWVRQQQKKREAFQSVQSSEKKT